MFYGEYEMYHDFAYDFSNIYFERMFLRISALPNFREILSTRYRFLNNKIKGMKENEQAKKILNKTQLEFFEEQEKETIIMKSASVHMFDVHAIQEKNRKKQNEGR